MGGVAAGGVFAGVVGEFVLSVCGAVALVARPSRAMGGLDEVGGGLVAAHRRREDRVVVEAGLGGASRDEFADPFDLVVTSGDDQDLFVGHGAGRRNAAYEPLNSHTAA